MSPTLIMLCGPSCAGKSTVSASLRCLFHATILSTDEIIVEEALNRGTTYAAIFAEYFGTANGIYRSNIRAALKADENIILDRTHTTTASRRRVLAAVPARYQKIAIAVGSKLTVEELVARRDERVKNNGIHVPDDVIARMHAQFTAEPPSVDEGFDLVLEYNDAVR